MTPNLTNFHSELFAVRQLHWRSQELVLRGAANRDAVGPKFETLKASRGRTWMGTRGFEGASVLS